MSRPPFSTAPAPQVARLRPAPRPGLPPVRTTPRDPSERRTLVVGRGISVQGTVQDAERLVVEGTVEATMIHATELAISPGGVFKGEIEVEDVEIAGTIDGTLTARGSLTVRATGKVLGTARCRRLQVEDGGQITARHRDADRPGETESAPAPARPVSQIGGLRLLAGVTGLDFLSCAGIPARSIAAPSLADICSADLGAAYLQLSTFALASGTWNQLDLQLHQVAARQVLGERSAVALSPRRVRLELGLREHTNRPISCSVPSASVP